MIERYTKIRQQTERLCASLQEEDCTVQPVVDVSPPKWHLAHTTWFFEEFVLSNREGYRVFDPNYSFMFNSYYESVGARVLRHHRGFMTRPTREEVLRYRAHVDEQMKDFLSGNEWHKLKDVIELGLQHEQQHQELLVTDIKYILGNNPLLPVYRSNSPEYGINALGKDAIRHLNEAEALAPGIRARKTSAISENYIEIPEGVYSIGYEGNDFFYDNEKGVHKVYLNPFRVQDRLVTNGEYMEFMEAGGYQNFRYWLADGWDWVKTSGAHAPMYWFPVNHEWHCYTLNGVEKVDPAAPVVHVNFYEADAFAHWKGKRMPTEFEWEVACKLWNKDSIGNFLDNNRLHPAARQGNSNQLYGDVWEWTNSAYLPYPHYQQADGALGEYNGKFMINQMVLRGGSCATPSDHIRPTYRNFFPPDKKWQFSGIRLAESL